MEISRPTISVAMCTYNGSRYLGEQLSGIASQQHVPDELVVCDDGSTDDTLPILERFAATVPFPVRVQHNGDRLGPTKNFEQAIRLCQGEFIVLSDQDDLWYPHKLTQLSSALERNSDALYAFSDADMINEVRTQLGYTLWETVGLKRELTRFSGPAQLETLLKKSLVTGATIILRSSFREVAVPIPTGWMHDAWIASLGSALSYGIAIPEILMAYRRHSTQACGWKSKTFRQVCTISLATSQQEAYSKVEQFQKLTERVSSARNQYNIRIECLRLLEQKKKHLLRRAEARGVSRTAKIRKVGEELFSGRYQRFSEGPFYSVMRDLC